MDTPPNSPLMPTWFRRTLIVVAALLMCSCRAYGQDCPSCPLGGDGYSDGCDQGACDQGCPAGGCVVVGCPVCQPQRYAGPGDEYLCDGGDGEYSTGVLRDGGLIGLHQEDTVATYTGCEGKTFVAPSTRVCIYAPRFASVRQVVHPMGAQQRTFVDAVGDLFGAAQADRTQVATTSLQNLALKGQVLPLPPGLYKGRQQAGGIERHLAAAEIRSLVGPYVNLQLMHLGEVVMSEGPIVAELSLAAITWTGDQEVQVAISGQAASAVFSPKQPGLLYHVDQGCPRLRLVKCASTDAAQPGEEVEFTLRYDNVGDSALEDLVLLDNLTTRLEYVDGSAKSSRDADFTTARNDAGSLVLRWAIDGKVEAGEGGLLTFKCRVR
ncbi:hypothetical protein Pla108_06030 [Botrimarina colliarenosi]|uniref:Uncharacterized protein n=1 Tax=Botrimarina colliarenosi TaxID=2528001 RepID=A0A5C6AJS2_9BACT|nr:DUF11 domain-containing protein [Botrimarina colliarenosi]TWT99660.1 hypothetical protein Pla108_06030 [Botrimarina colliarenosi]